MSTLSEQLKNTEDLDEKLRLIDEMMKLVTPRVVNGKVIAPADPSILTICDGCE